MICSSSEEEIQEVCGAFVLPRVISVIMLYRTVIISRMIVSFLIQNSFRSGLYSPVFLPSVYCGTGRTIPYPIITAQIAPNTFRTLRRSAKYSVSAFRCPIEAPRRILLSRTIPSLMNTVKENRPRRYRILRSFCRIHASARRRKAGKRYLSCILIPNTYSKIKSSAPRNGRNRISQLRTVRDRTITNAYAIAPIPVHVQLHPRQAHRINHTVKTHASAVSARYAFLSLFRMVQTVPWTAQAVARKIGAAIFAVLSTALQFPPAR